MGLLAGLPLALSQAPVPENTGPNKNILRREVGSWSRGREREREDWQLIAHPDGSRTLIATHFGQRGMADAIVRVGPQFEPLSAYVVESSRNQPARSRFERDRWPAGMSVPLESIAALQDDSGRLGRGADRTLPAPRVLPAPRRIDLDRAGLQRWATGRYAYTTLKDSRARGNEFFRLAVHADGSRSLLMWHDVFARHSQFTIGLRIDARQRPLGAFVSYWTAAGYKGATHIKVDGETLTADYRGAAGDTTQSLAVPPVFSIGTHPVAGDGWHTFGCAAGAATTRVYTLEASADLTKPVLGQMTDLSCEALGAERITVPAGTFDTLHYRLAGVSDVWITREDRLMVKFVSERLDRAYTLVEFRGTGFDAAHKRRT